MNLYNYGAQQKRPKVLSKRNSRILYQILPFGIIPAIFSMVQSMLEKGILGNHPIYPSTGNPYEANFLIPILTSFTIGLIIGLFEAFYVNKRFQSRSFFEKVLFKSGTYILAIIIATMIIIVAGHSINQRLSPFSETVWSFVWSFFTNFAFWSIIVFYSIAIISSIFYAEVSENMGQSVFFNFVTGKYHQPKVEQRTFMFLDMKSSTAHAEKLGHIRYFQMLKDYYADLSKPILNYGGEIYQYVGDEIVITWKGEKEIAKPVLDCFFAMERQIKNQHQKYLSNYGIIPTFKAGIHHGMVTTGEVGLIKKDIVFSGDTLNTTARIQGLCNQFNVSILVSGVFINAIKSTKDYSFKSHGEVELRGRNKKAQLFSVHQH